MTDAASGHLSPDGGWIVYSSKEVYVQKFPSGKSKFQLSTAGGYSAVWSRDGKRVFYVSSKQQLMAVDVQAGERFEAGPPRVLFENVRSSLPSGNSVFAVSADGKRFLIPTLVEENSKIPLTVVLNWPGMLKKPAA